MLFNHEVSFEIEFRVDRTSTVPGRSDDFIVVDGELLSGPAYRSALTIDFDAKLADPDGNVSYAKAQLHYPADPDLIEETEIFLNLFAVGESDVPLGTRVFSIGAERAVWPDVTETSI